jgi:CRP-like cAMP-binding protein
MNTINPPLANAAPELPAGSDPREHPFFRLLSPAHGERIARFAVHRHYAAQTHLFHADAETDEFHLIVTGNIVLETPYLPGRGTVIIEELGPGDLLGCSWLFDALHWQYSARALSDVETICFDTGKLRAEIALDHELGYELAMCIGTTMLHRLDRTRRELLTAYEHNY